MRSVVLSLVVLLGLSSVAQAQWPYFWWEWKKPTPCPPFLNFGPVPQKPHKPRKKPMPNWYRYELRLWGLEAQARYERRLEELRAERRKKMEHRIPSGKKPGFVYDGVRYDSYSEFKKTKAYLRMSEKASIEALHRNLRLLEEPRL